MNGKNNQSDRRESYKLIHTSWEKTHTTLQCWERKFSFIFTKFCSFSTFYYVIFFEKFTCVLYPQFFFLAFLVVMCGGYMGGCTCSFPPYICVHTLFSVHPFSMSTLFRIVLWEKAWIESLHKKPVETICVWVWLEMFVIETIYEFFNFLGALPKRFFFEKQTLTLFYSFILYIYL